MAPAEVSAYMPPLDKCLNGEKQLLSWKLAYTALAEDVPSVGQNALRRFLTESTVTDVLSNLLKPQSTPTTSSRSKFDNDTSAINVTPNGNGKYELQQIKDDTLWLSNAAALDEISALRVIVLEWQSRSGARLLHESESEELPAFSGSMRLKSSLLLSRIRASPKAEKKGPNDFDSEVARRSRILNTYFSERRFLIKTLAHIVFRTICEPKPPHVDASSNDDQKRRYDRWSWVDRAGSQILAAWKLDAQKITSEDEWFRDIIARLGDKINAIAAGSKIAMDETMQEGVELRWSETQATETLNLMHVVFTLAQSSQTPWTARGVSEWFNLMHQLGFFGSYELPYEELNQVYLYNLRSMATMASLAILNVPVALDTVSGLSSGALTNTDAKTTIYLQDLSCIHEITISLLDGAANQLLMVKPLALAWSIILQDARAYADTSQQARDNRHAQRAADNINSSAISDTESNDGSGERRRSSPHRRASFGSDSSQQLTFLEEVVDVLQKIEPSDDVINLLARFAVQEPGAFEVMTNLSLEFSESFGVERDGSFGLRFRITLLDLITASIFHIDYQPDLVSTVLAVLTGGSNYWDNVARYRQRLNFDIVSYFREKDILMTRIFETARTRFPYESLPYLRLCQALTFSLMSGKDNNLSIVTSLENLPTLTTIFYESEAAYELTGEGDSMYIRLQSPLDVSATGQGVKAAKLQLLPFGANSQDQTSSDVMILPTGTSGRPLTDGKPLVVMFRYPYSGLKYAGCVLRQALQSRTHPRVELTESILEIANEIIGLLAGMLMTTHLSAGQGPSLSTAQLAARGILEDASDGLGRNQDVISIILEMYEDELYSQKASNRNDLPTDFLVQCTQFLHSLLAILPGRVWPFLGRSGLLGINGVESRLVNVVAVSEVPAGQFAFLLSTVHLFESLVDDAISHAVARRATSAATNRFRDAAPNSIGSGITEALMQKIILHFEKIMIDILESTGNWRFVAVHQRLEINAIICRTFEKIMASCYDTDDNDNLSMKFCSALAPSAEYLLEVFLSSSSNDLPVQPLVQTIREGVDSPTNTMPVNIGRLRIELTEATIRLVDRLMRVNTFLGRAPSRLEQRLLGSISAIAQCYAVHERYRLPVVKLLDALVRGCNRSSELPPSLLGHMGSSIAKSFIDLLSVLDEPLEDVELGRYIWRLLSGVVSERQQWFAIYLLTGSTPKDSLVDKSTNTKSDSPPVLDVAITKLRRLPHTDLKDSISVLEFLTLAIDFWPSICEKIRNDAALIKTFSDFLANLANSQHHRTPQEPLLETYRFQVAAYISNIFAIIAHRRNEMHDDTFGKQILPSLDFLIQNGVSTPKYNASLHGKLRKNFELRYAGCKLHQFKRTSICPPELGDRFYYDIEFADRLLQHDSAWAPTPNQGFFNEFLLANRNLSLVEAQMSLFHAWRSLVVELSFGLDITGNFQNSIASTIRMCLTANLDSTLPELVFSKLAQSRASLAFTLLQRLITSARISPDAQSILTPAWDALRISAPDLGVALAGPDADYNRTLLKIVYQALQAYLTEKVEPGSLSSVSRKTPFVTTKVLEILKSCVASGFRSMITVLHEDVTKILPSDLALVSGILRSCLHVPEVDRQTEILASMFADDNTALYASTLLSWSHQLTIDRDPVFGELSLNFILELSSVPVLAEYVVSAGTMGQIATAELMDYFRRPGGCGPFDEPVRMYSIWTRAILPFTINLLTGIGAPIVGNVASFLNQFGPQLERASTVLDTKTTTTGYASNRAGYVTLATASEVHLLAMIASVLDMFREAGPSVGVVSTEIPDLAWDRAIVKSDLETRLERRRALREDIIPMDEREEAWSKQKPLNARLGAENRLEEKVVDELSAAMALLGDTET